MLVKNWHRDGAQKKRERLAPAKLRSIKASTKQLRKRLQNG
jgi:hypothetical protein